MVTLFPLTNRIIAERKTFNTAISNFLEAMKGRTTSRKRPRFGARLAALRHERQLTQRALAAKLGVDRSLIRYYERDACDPKLGFLRTCAAALGVPFEVLAGHTKERGRNGSAELDRFVAKLRQLKPATREVVLRMFSPQLAAALKKDRG